LVSDSQTKTAVISYHHFSHREVKEFHRQPTPIKNRQKSKAKERKANGGRKWMIGSAAS
jgi:hypothetical protein